MMTSTRRFYLSALLSLCLTPALTARAQPPEAAVKTPDEAQKVQEPKTLPLVTWDELKKQLGGPTLITLHAKEMSIIDTIDALNKQSPVPVKIQNRLYLEQQNKKTLTADYEAQPFWTVARDIAEKVGIGLQNYGGANITFTPWVGQNDGITSDNAVGTFMLNNASYNRYVGQGKGEQSRSESLSLSCTLFADPKLQWQNQGLVMHLTEALDDKNQSLLPTEDSDIYNQGVPLQMNLQLKAVDTKGGTLKRLRGTFHGAVAFVSETWEVPDVLKAKNVEKIIAVGDATTRVELQNVIQKGEAYAVTLVISQSGAARQQTKLSTGKQFWLNDNFYNQVRLVDAEGRDLQLREQSSDDGGGDKETRIVTYTATFYPNRNGDDDDHSDAPVKFIMPYASDWRELILPFEFKDVKLP